MTDDPRFWFRYVGGVAVVSLARDDAGVPLPADALPKLVALERGRLVFALPADGMLGGVAGSAMLGWLVTLHRKAQAAGGAIRLHCPAGPLRDVLRITKLDRLFAVHDTLDAAVRDF